MYSASDQNVEWFKRFLPKVKSAGAMGGVNGAMARLCSRVAQQGDSPVRVATGP